MFTDINSQLYYKSAQESGLLITYEQDIAGFYVALSNKRYYFRSGVTPFNVSSNAYIAENRQYLNLVLNQANLPVPKMIICSKEVFNQKAIEEIITNFKFPLIIRPCTPSVTYEDVISNITSLELLYEHLNKSFYKYESMVIEEFHASLKSYRVLVFNNQILGVIQRYPTMIVGDGIHTIAELIAMHTYTHNHHLTKSMFLSEIDEEYNIRLKELNLSYETILDNKQTIPINYTSHPSRGGINKSLGNNICKENAELLCHAARVLGMKLVGFDIICENILKPITPQRGFILSASSNPDISDHESPIYGIKNPVSKQIINQLIWNHPISYILTKFKMIKIKVLPYDNFFIKAFILIFIFAVWRTL